MNERLETSGIFVAWVLYCVLGWIIFKPLFDIAPMPCKAMFCLFDGVASYLFMLLFAITEFNGSLN